MADPTEWQLVGFVPRGPLGDRYLITATRDAPNSLTRLFRQLQQYDSVADDYVTVGAAEEFSQVYDGWVHVGFYMPSATDNGDGTVTFWRQWYCRESAESNVFNPEGDPEEMGTANLPEGPPGPYYNITLVQGNPPDEHIGYFYRYRYEFNPVTGLYESVDNGELIGQVEAPEGPQGPQGLRGYYYLITSDNPPGADDVVYFYRQLHDPDTGQPVPGMPVEMFGGAVAAQGPPPDHEWSGTSLRFEEPDHTWGAYVDLEGPAGPQGPTGPAGPQGPAGASGLTIGTDWRTAGEFEKLSYVSRRETEAMLRMIIEAAYATGTVAEVVGAVIAGLAGIAGAAVTGGVSLVAGGIVGTALGSSLTAIAEAGIDNLVGTLEQETTIDAIAKDLYCTLIDYRYFDSVSINNFVAAYQDRIIADEVIAGDYSDAVRGLLAHHWSALGTARAQEEIGMITLQYAYNPAFDYTSLPCTPNLGTWQRVYDFTVDEQGWVSPSPGLWAAYHPGDGWGPVSAYGTKLAQIELDFGGTTTVTYVELLSANVTWDPAGSGRVHRIWEAAPEIKELKRDTDPPNGLVTTTWTGEEEMSKISVDLTRIIDGRIVRVSMTGTGDAPPEP